MQDARVTRCFFGFWNDSFKRKPKSSWIGKTFALSNFREAKDGILDGVILGRRRAASFVLLCDKLLHSLIERLQQTALRNRIAGHRKKNKILGTPFAVAVHNHKATAVLICRSPASDQTLMAVTWQRP